MCPFCNRPGRCEHFAGFIGPDEGVIEVPTDSPYPQREPLRPADVVVETRQPLRVLWVYREKAMTAE